MVLKLREHLNDDATIAGDIGTNYIHMARHFRVYRAPAPAVQQRPADAGRRPALGHRREPGPAGHAGPVGVRRRRVPVQRDGAGDRPGWACTFTHVLMRDNSYDMVAFQQMMKFGRNVRCSARRLRHRAATPGRSAPRIPGPAQGGVPGRTEQSLSEDGSIIDVPVDYSHSTDLGAQLHEGVFE